MHYMHIKSINKLLSDIGGKLSDIQSEFVFN